MDGLWTYLDESVATRPSLGALRGEVVDELGGERLTIYFPGLGVRREAEVVRRGVPLLGEGPAVGDEVLCLFEEEDGDEQARCHVIGWRKPETDGEVRTLALPGGITLTYDGQGHIHLASMDGNQIDFDARRGQIALKARSDLRIESDEGNLLLRAPKGGVLIEAAEQVLLQSESDLTLCGKGSAILFGGTEARLSSTGSTHVRAGGDTLYLDAAHDLHARVEERLMLHSQGHATLQSVDGRLNLVSEEHMNIHAREGDIIQVGRKVRLN